MSGSWELDPAAAAHSQARHIPETEFGEGMLPDAGHWTGGCIMTNAECSVPRLRRGDTETVRHMLDSLQRCPFVTLVYKISGGRTNYWLPSILHLPALLHSRLY